MGSTHSDLIVFDVSLMSQSFTSGGSTKESCLSIPSVASVAKEWSASKLS